MAEIKIVDIKALNPGYKIETFEMQIGICKICNCSIRAQVPSNLLVQVEEKPLFCESCRNGLLHLIHLGKRYVLEEKQNE